MIDEQAGPVVGDAVAPMNETEQAVVRWLRKRALRVLGKIGSGEATVSDPSAALATSASYVAIADAIERGEHKETNDAC